jgi:tol-pal system protein YbgF
MKRYLILIFLSSLLSACVEDTSTLKVRLINLESRLNFLENRVAKLENDTQALESRITKAIVERQSLIVSDLEEVKKEQLRLQAQLEDLSYKIEGKEREEKATREDLLTRVSALELRLKRIESLVQPSNEMAIQNATTQNATSNQMVVQQSEVQKEKQTNGLHTEKPTLKTQEKAKQQEVPKNLKEEDLFHQAYLHFQKGDYRLARSYWEEYLKRYPKGRWVGQTYYWLGETYFKEKNYEEAIIYYQKLIDLPEPNPFKPKAMLKQAEAFLQLKDKKAAEIVLKKLVKTFPGTQEAKAGEKILKGLK